MLTLRSVVFALALAFVIGYALVRFDFLWTWPLAALIVLAAWWIYGQKITYTIPEDPDA